MLKCSLRLIAVLSWSVVLLAGCGGGGGGGGAGAGTAGTVEGFWDGTTSTGRSIGGFVLDNGNYWMVYTAPGNNAVIGGIIQGRGSASDSSFTSSNARDISFEGLGVNAATISANFAAMQTLDGTITYPGLEETAIFNTNYQSFYDLVPSLATLAGTYNGTAVTGEGYDSAAITISSTGVVTGQSGLGCEISGTAAVHASGNVYDISIRLGGGNCPSGTASMSGVAFLADANTMFYVAANSGRTSGLVFSAMR